MKRKARDEEVWSYFGTYGISAVLTAVEHCLAGRKAVSKYIVKPNLSEGGACSKGMSEDEMQRQRELFAATLEAMKTNFEINHPKKKDNEGGEVS